MGRDKGALRVGGESLLARQARVLAQAGVGERIVSLRPGQPHPDPTVELPVVRDWAPGAGPLAGIVAGLHRVAPRDLVVLAVDMPGIDAAHLAPLVEGTGAGRTVAYRIDGRWEPLCTRYAPDVLPEAKRRLARGQGSPSALLDALADRGRVDPIEVPTEEAGGFRSWNRPEDVEGPESPP